MQKPKSLKERFATGEFVVSVQIDPPTSGKLFKFRRLLGQLHRAGVEVVDVNSSRRISHDSIHLSTELARRRKKFEVIPHVTLRDSSLNSLLNRVLTSYTWSGGRVHNFLVVRGDPFEKNQAPMPGVYETDSAGAIRAFHEILRVGKGLDLAFAAAVNQNERHKEEGPRLVEKQKAGADFFMSQPVFNIEQANGLLDLCSVHVSVPLVVGIWPLLATKPVDTISAGEIPGVVLPPEVRSAAITVVRDEKSLVRWGTERALELIRYIKASGKAQGIYIVAPSRDPLLLLELLKEV